MSASRLYDKRMAQTKAYEDEQHRFLNAHQETLPGQGMSDDQQRQRLEEEQARVDAELQQRWQRVWRTEDKRNKEREKYQRYAQQQCDLLRALEDLATTERTMYELDNRKDHIMTVFKIFLTNLALWTRDHYFPQTYAHATWGRLLPFFQLSGRVAVDEKAVSVTFRPFNDKQLNQDLTLLCERVKMAAPHLPDGRLLLFMVGEKSRPILDQHKQRVA